MRFFFFFSYQYIEREWLPNNKKYERVPFGAGIEWYEERFNPVSEESEMDIYIPIREKS
ncbi:MAG: hypothetical protein ACXABO_01620 [Promethearchaeota archaeon]|jgi:predicted transcriptional regulator YdeE